VAGAREGYRTARAELGNRLPPGSMDAVLDAYRTEGVRLVETARAVDLVGRALRGEVFAPQLAGTQDEDRSEASRRGAPSRRGTGGQRGGSGQRSRGGKRSSAKERAERPSEAKTAKQR
jgi:hypothetical protein